MDTRHSSLATRHPLPEPHDSLSVNQATLYAALAPGEHAPAGLWYWDPVIDLGKDPIGPTWRDDLRHEVLVEVYDPLFLCCGFRNERVFVVWAGRPQQWQIVAPHGLRQTAVLDAPLTPNGSAAGHITGDGGLSTIDITVHSHSPGGDPPGSNVLVTFQPDDHEWWTGAYNKT